MVISKEKEIHAENAKNYINFNEALIQKLSVSFKSLFLEMNSVSLRMKEISEIYNQLNIVSEKTYDVKLLKLTELECNCYRYL